MPIDGESPPDGSTGATGKEPPTRNRRHRMPILTTTSPATTRSEPSSPAPSPLPSEPVAVGPPG
jgi:hypothetical protein